MQLWQKVVGQKIIEFPNSEEMKLFAEAACIECNVVSISLKCCYLTDKHASRYTLPEIL